MRKVKIKKEDQVVVISGKDKDLTKPRRVLQVMGEPGRVLVEGVNRVKRHTKPNPQRNIKGGVLEREAPIAISNVMLFDPEQKRGTRVGWKVLEDGSRARVSKRSGAILDK